MTGAGGPLVRLVLAAMLAGCSVTTADTDQFARMSNESPDARTRESIACSARDLLCARLVEMRGLACASRANDHALPAAERDRLRACALADARAIPSLLPADAGPRDGADAALLVFDAYRVARDANDPAATPGAMQQAGVTLAALPGGAGYAQVLASDGAVFDVLTNRTPPADACARLAAAQRGLPPDAQGHLKERADDVASAARSAAASKGCHP